MVVHVNNTSKFYFFYFYFYFILLYNTVLVLPYFDMNHSSLHTISNEERKMQEIIAKWETKWPLSPQSIKIQLSADT